MPKGTAVAAPDDTSTALSAQEQIEAQIRAAQDEEDEGEISFRTPILKLCQSLTKEVKDGNAEAGEFLNTLTGDSLGTKVEFVIAYYQPGRSASTKDGRYLVAVGEPNIPESWADLVGEEFVGTPFSEYPDAEEQYKKRVNSKEIEWGKGPAISTTYNYTGLVRDPVDPDGEAMPVRVSFLRTTKGAHEKIQLLRKSLLRGKNFWAVPFEFSTKSKTFGRNEAFIVEVKQSTTPTTPEETARAVELATAVLGGRVTDNAAEVEATGPRVEPEAKGGLGV